ncbi:hypothetical protein E2C01_025838 [Portunus trituberculatus]|uniref:Uncharacterized protein n=1 Tax=Portunus trituberculatus TaxID=210409 RepID=A0A5B7EGL2_PORTR|nr:hypothetical protein [Portunus trituberculatus]
MSYPPLQRPFTHHLKCSKITDDFPFTGSSIFVAPTREAKAAVICSVGVHHLTFSLPPYFIRFSRLPPTHHTRPAHLPAHCTADVPGGGGRTLSRP